MSQTRADVIRAFIPASPFARELGIELVDLRLDEAELRLPYEPRLATLGDVVHGGAIAALLDTAGMAAAWSDDTLVERAAGATVSMNVAYAAAAVASDLTAHARVVRRRRTLCFCEVTITELLRGHDHRRRGRGRRPRLDGPPLRLAPNIARARAWRNWQTRRL